MSYDKYQSDGSPLQAERTPWLIFLFLAVLFFLGNYDLSYSKRGIGNYNQSGEELVTETDDGSISRRVAVLSLGLFAIASLVSYRPYGRLRINGALLWILPSFAGWALLSPIWAEDLPLTLRRVTVFAIYCVAAVAVARRFSPRDIALWTFTSTSVFVGTGFLAELSLGTFRPLASGYRFAGMLHPNGQAIDCGLLLLSGVVAAQLEKRRRILYWAGALLGFVFLILTQSRTGAISGFLALASYLTAVCSRFTKIATAYGLGIFICFVLLISVNGTPRSLKAAMSLGREESTVGSFESFNGRTDIWDACANYVARRPVTGYGFGGFWNENHIAEISARNHWGVGAGHSAYLDYLLQLGAVGLITYILTLFVSLRRAFRFHSLSRDPAFAFCGALLVLCAVEGFLESTIMTPTSPLFICMVAVTRLALEAPPRKVARQFIDRGRSTLMPRLVYDGEKISLG